MAPLKGTSSKANEPAVTGTNTGGGDGVSGTGWRGVVGTSNKFQGVFGKSVDNAGIVGESDKLHGVFGICHNPNGAGVYGTNDKGEPGAKGVLGECANGDGVVGTGWRGIVGLSDRFQGVFGKSIDNAGVVGESDKLHGVFGICHNPNGAALYGTNDAGGFAAIFDGRVEHHDHVTCHKDIFMVNADVAEEFDVVGDRAVEPGCVVVLAGDDAIRVCDRAYDRRVAGVVSGAGNYRPALVLHRKPRSDRRALALSGKVWCKVDASRGPIELGDLLTTSSTPGHAMCARDAGRAFGAVIGKALGGLRSGRGLVPVLVALQ
jgi:hypothetical protein